MNFNDVKKAIAGKDMVYANLAGNQEVMATNIAKAIPETGVKRIIAISSIGIYETSIKQVLILYRKLADMIEALGLDYIILRTDWLTNGNEIDYAITQKGESEIGSAISRKNIAAFIATTFNNSSLHRNENIGISKPD